MAPKIIALPPLLLLDSNNINMYCNRYNSTKHHPPREFFLVGVLFIQACKVSYHNNEKEFKLIVFF